MIKNLKQFVPEKVCLSCDGCCRFKDEQSEWRPKVGPAEIATAAQGLVERILSKEHVAADQRLKTTFCHGEHFCSFFNPAQNTCGIYSHRPFDCQLYPFILLKKPQGLMLAVHLNCPFIQEKFSTSEFTEYVAYLRTFFQRSDVRLFLRDNPDLAGNYQEYRDELEELFAVNP